MWFVIATALTFAAADEAALDPGESPSKPALDAREAFERAEELYRLGDFEDALQLYRSAYEQSQLPGLLFNIGQCYFGLDNFSRAVFYYEQYLDADPDSAYANTVRQLIDEATRRGERAEQQQLADAERLRLVAEREAEAERLKALNAALERERLMAKAPPPPADSWLENGWFWGAVGAVVVGGVLTFVLVSDSDDPSLGTLDRR